MNDPEDKSLGGTHMKGIVRMVAMQQLGQFMMGIARIKNFSITLSGSYGGDGLPVYKVPQEVYNEGKDIPEWLYKLWEKGGGHNSCGSETEEMRKWAKENFQKYFKEKK
jgi:hypothetical protein